MRTLNSPFSLLLALAARSYAAPAECTVEAMKEILPDAHGIKITNVYADVVKQWNGYHTSTPTIPALPAEGRPIDFCNVTVVYTHPGESGSIRIHNCFWR